jgi:glycosyltransferase A (GT-A) superfamily protein (DUF2064 family)
MLDDVYEAVAALAQVEPVLALVPGDQPDAEAVTWPGTRIVRVPASHDGAEVLAVLEALATPPACEAVAVVTADAPDLPGLLIGKLFRGLGSAEVAACPAEGGGLVALAARVPSPAWLVEGCAGIDAPDALQRLAAAAPRRSALAVAPGWHRVRSVADLGRLDRGLEGWDSTRALLVR